MRERILIVDDETNVRSALAELLREEGYATDTAADGFKALPKLEQWTPDALITDLSMPGLSGLELLAKARVRNPDCVLVVMTGAGDVASAVEAMKLGAVDYLAKPVDLVKLLTLLQRELGRRRVRIDSGELRARSAGQLRIKNLVGTSPVMQRVIERVIEAAPWRSTVLLTGEAGTGKELIAAGLHAHGPRATGPFVKVHCAAASESQLDAELFGQERAGLGGTAGRRPGRIEQADGGTLFLDEVGELSPAIQVKLLRFLEEQTLETVSGAPPLKLDVRVIAASRHDLRKRVEAGQMREDLYYRLNVVAIELPPLRARQTDVALLAYYFSTKIAAANGKTVTGFTDEALVRLASQPWPGNVRELENTIERAVVVCRGGRIGVEDLKDAFEQTAAADGEMPPIPGSKLEDLERYAILKTLEHTGGSTSQAADLLGISPRKIQYRLQVYGPGIRKTPA